MNYEDILKCFPTEIKEEIKVNLNNEIIYTKLEEIRIRTKQKIILKVGQDEILLKHTVTREDINNILIRICDNSLYTYQNQISKGFITIKGGHRVGICGSRSFKK